MFKKGVVTSLVSVLSMSALASPAGEVFVSVNGQAAGRMVYEIIEGEAITEGDIILGSAETLQRQGAIVIKDEQKVWPGGVIPFVIDESLSKAALRNLYFALMHFKRWTKLTFIEVTDQNKDHYPDYIRFKDNTGCSSYVGRQGGEQPVNLSSACGYAASIHELGHALGFTHEHNRADRDQYIRINYENIMDGKAYNYNQSPNSYRDFGPYDFKSIMHYGAYDFSKNGQPTITVLDETHRIENNNGLSEGDLKAIESLYPAIAEGT